MPASKMIKTILVPVDFSEASESALAWACDLAETLNQPQGGAEVVPMHAFDIPAYGLPEGSYYFSADTMTRLSEESQAQLTQLEKKFASRHVRRSILRTGAPWDEVNALVKELDVQLIVMGTHGRRGISRALMGSVAERVVRTAEVPVVTIRKPAPKA